jgi:hypothetical protein
VFKPATATTTLATPTFSPTQLVIATSFNPSLGFDGLHLTTPAGVDVTATILLTSAGLLGWLLLGGGKLTALILKVLLWLTFRRVALTEVTRAGAPAAANCILYLNDPIEGIVCLADLLFVGLQCLL